tara:strand:+ start:392 stop:736 length:345 start_codon:yes stop_codon:yes gene_type:complete
MNTETTNWNQVSEIPWNTQDWTETEVEMFIDELKKYHNSDNQQIFTICEETVFSNNITVSIPTSPSSSDLNVIWKAERKYYGEDFYQVHEICMFKQIMKATNPNSDYFKITANF